MKKIVTILAAAMAVVVSGCAVVPVAPRTNVVVSQPVVVEEDYVGTAQPLYFDAYPGVTFYQRWDAIGCNCIVPVAFVGGIWITHLGAPVVYGGGWHRPPPHIIVTHRERLRANPQMFHRTQGRPMPRPHEAPAHNANKGPPAVNAPHPPAAKPP